MFLCPVFQNITNRYTTPLEPIAKEPKPFISKTSPPHSMSPYYMRNESPDKRFMSGECTTIKIVPLYYPDNASNPEKMFISREYIYI